ncbi:MAG: hypothetical protein QOI66_2244 [Myxococcales bacterium]|nr:hypothetical protein [Myxococcales bacterium]
MGFIEQPPADPDFGPSAVGGTGLPLPEPLVGVTAMLPPSLMVSPPRATPRPPGGAQILLTGPVSRGAGELGPAPPPLLGADAPLDGVALVDVAVPGVAVADGTATQVQLAGQSLSPLHTVAVGWQ